MDDLEIYERVMNAGKRPPCTHPWQHTIYGSWIPGRNGTYCVICGERR